MKDSVVVVTGGGRGIGRAICEGFATQGARVMATSRDEAALQETKTIIESSGGICETHSADVSDEASVNALIENTCSRWGRIDVMVNCAGVAPMHSIEELSPDRFDGMNAVNIRGVYLGSRAVWPVMKKQGGGVIITLSSQASVEPFPGFSAYGATKAWVNAWTKGLADEGKAHGIRVFAIAPGAVETRMLRDAIPDFPTEQALDPKVVADFAVMQARPSCQYATGQTIFIKR